MNSLSSQDFLKECFRIPHDAPPRWLLMLTAYVDETGQEQDDWMFIAGYYGDDAAWKRVANAWSIALGPQRKHLHMKTLRFKRESERKMLAQLGRIPVDCGLVPILGGVRWKDFHAVVQGNADEQIMSGYIVCLWAMLYDTLRHLPEGERLEIVFEEQNIYGALAQVAIRVFTESAPSEVLLADGRSKLANWRWASKDSTSLLEPADYLCYALAKFHKERGSVRDEWSRPILRNQEGQGFGAILTKTEIRKILKRMGR
jgi:hypothetical protein